MTDLNQLRRANDLMAQTTIDVDEFLAKVATDEDYLYKRTNHYRAYIALQKSAKSKPPIIPPPPPVGHIDLARGQNILFLTSDVSHAMETNVMYKLAATADLGYRDKYPENFLRAAISSGRFRIWCDCRAMGEGTPPSVARAWAAALGLQWPQVFIGQGENQYEFDRAVASGTGTIVGNINPATPENPGGLRSDQWAKIDSGEIIFTNETYWNVDPYMPPITWHNLDGVAGNCVAVYESAREGAKYYPLAKQQAEGKFAKGRDSVYVADFRDADWAVLR